MLTILAGGWVIASLILYTVLVKGAKEPQNEHCMDCKLTDCAACPIRMQTTEEYRRAA